MRRMEYGGCLWFELSGSYPDYYSQYKGKRIEVDSGRSAIQYLIEKYRFKRIWLPVYNCPLVFERIKRVSSIETILYNLKEDFSPNIRYDLLKKGDVVLWVNYCGVMHDALINQVANIQTISEADVIIDNIPAFFSPPRMKAFNIYSCRKFIGIPDGGYLIGDKVNEEVLETYDTSDNYLYLLRAIEKGSNTVYGEYQNRESKITAEDKAYGMPKLTRRVLESIDYKYIKEKRRKNFLRLHELLGGKNRLEFNHETETASVYPYLTGDKSLREKLIDDNIYVSRFWKHVLTNEKANLFEKNLAELLIPLPIDQRYNEEDISYLARAVERLEHLDGNSN